MAREPSRRGGFPCNIFCNRTKSETFLCQECSKVCRSPVTCQSGSHLFCLCCLTQSLQLKSYCPVCQEPLTAPSSSTFATAQVSALDVVCVHEKCRWKGTCGRLDSHLDIECLHEPIKCSGEGGCATLVPRGEMATHQQFACPQSCPNSKPKSGNDQDVCDVRLSRADLIVHLKDHCKLRLVHCPHQPCELSTRFNLMPTHLETCLYAPVPCPLQCGASKLTRGSLGAHRGDCPKENVACVHAPLGCSHVAPRDQIAQHEQDIRVHFMALSKAFVQLQQSHQQLKELHQQVQKSHQEQICQLDQKLQVQSSLLEKLQAQAAVHGKDLHTLRPMVASARAEAAKVKADAARAKAEAEVKADAEAKTRAEAAKAKVRADAEAKANHIMQALRCLRCNEAAVIFYKNPQVQPWQYSAYHIYGFSGNCGKCIDWEGHLKSSIRSKCELVEAILSGNISK